MKSSKQQFVESFGKESDAASLEGLIRGPAMPDFAQLDRESKDEIQHRILEKLKVRESAIPGVQALFGLREQELPLVHRMVHHLGRTEPVVAFAVAEGLLKSGEEDRRVLGINLLGQFCGLDAYPQFKEIGRQLLRELSDPASDCSPNEKEDARWWLEALGRGIKTPEGDKVVGRPQIGESRLGFLREVTNAFSAPSTQAASSLVDGPVFSELRSSEGRMIAAYAGMVVGLRDPEAFRQKVMPKFAASSDKGLQLVAEVFGKC